MKTKRKVLITGATGSLGKSLTNKFSADDYEVITTSRHARSGSELHFKCDLSDSEELTKFCQEIEGIGIDIIVNNAGINVVKPFLEISRSEIEKSLQINLISPFLLTQAVIPNMITKGWGRIVNIGSILGQISRPGRSNYSSSKSGLAGFTRSIASEFAQAGITCNYVAPGYLDTPLTRNNLSLLEQREIQQRIPINRFGSTDEVSNLVQFLASDEASFITGQTFTIDGGQLAT